MNSNLKAAPVSKHEGQLTAADLASMPAIAAYPFDASQVSPDLSRKRTEAQDLIAKANLIIQGVEAEEQAEKTAENARLNAIRNGHLLDAQAFRDQARREKDPEEKRDLLRLAMDADNQANEIGGQLGIKAPMEPQEPKEIEPFLKRNRRLVAIAQIIAIVLLVCYFKGLFEMFGEQILDMNKLLPAEKQMQPYDLTSIQKFFFEKFVVFADLPLALLMLLIVAPFIGFYVLPFLKSKRDFYTEFYEELTPWQRSVLSTAFMFGFLLYLALSHSVKP